MKLKEFSIIVLFTIISNRGSYAQVKISDAPTDIPVVTFKSIFKSTPIVTYRTYKPKRKNPELQCPPISDIPFVNQTVLEKGWRDHQQAKTTTSFAHLVSSSIRNETIIYQSIETDPLIFQDRHTSIYRYVAPTNELMRWPNYPSPTAETQERWRKQEQNKKVIPYIVDQVVTSWINGKKRTGTAQPPKF